jgi:hypothetical protein
MEVSIVHVALMLLWREMGLMDSSLLHFLSALLRFGQWLAVQFLQ